MVAGEAGDGPAAISLAESLRPDIVLLDLQAARHGRRRRAAAAARGGPAGAGADQRDRAERGRGAVRAGAAGVVYKDIDPAALVRAIRSVHDGNVLLAPEAIGSLIRGSRADTLTAREREVLAGIADGKSNREIARLLRVSEKTVKAHVSAVLAKLGVQDRTQAAVYAVRHGKA